MNETECLEYIKLIKEKPYKALPKYKLKKKATGFCGRKLIDWLFYYKESQYLYDNDFSKYLEQKRHDFCCWKHFYLYDEDINVEEFNQLKRCTDYDVTYLNNHRYLFRERTGWHYTELFKTYTGYEVTLTLNDNSIPKLKYWDNPATDYGLISAIAGKYKIR